MNKDNTISLQEVRRDPLGFFKLLNNGKKVTVIYHSRPYATVVSADGESAMNRAKSTARIIEYAKLARGSAKLAPDKTKSYKDLYYRDEAKKYGIS